MKRIMLLATVLVLLVLVLGGTRSQPVQAAPTTKVAIVRCTLAAGAYTVTASSASETITVVAANCAQTLANLLNDSYKITDVQQEQTTGSLVYTLTGKEPGPPPKKKD
jgi:hypothetical protein